MVFLYPLAMALKYGTPWIMGIKQTKPLIFFENNFSYTCKYFNLILYDINYKGSLYALNVLLYNIL